jgi:hypothetical protein
MSKGGRPTKYTPELGQQICDLISDGNTTLAVSRILKIKRHTIVDWSRKIPEFSSMYAEARDRLLEHWADEVVEDSLNESRDYHKRKRIKTIRSDKGDSEEITEEVVSDNTAVQRDRLKVDAKKWLLSKLRPKEYGDRIETQLTGKEGETLVPVLNINISKDVKPSDD